MRKRLAHTFPSMSESLCPDEPARPGLIGIFGGTFDPVHLGHLRLAEEAREALRLARVRWIPAGQPPHRSTPQLSGMHRLAMVRLAVADNPGFELDAAEVEASRPSYTVLTLERLRQQLGPDQALVLLLGADAFAGLASWHRWQEVLQLTHVAVLHRPGYGLDPKQLDPALATLWQRCRVADAAELATRAAGGLLPLPMTQLDISATHIRTLLAAGRSARYLLPGAVLDYIARHQLYRKEPDS